MTLKTWPTVVDRNVAQPSRVKLTPAYAAGDDVYDVTPIPGTVAAEGTLLNKALFDGEKAYVDQNDIPLIELKSTDGINYTGTCAAWQGATAAELNTKICVFRNISTVDNKTLTPSFTINGNISGKIYSAGPSTWSNGVALPHVNLFASGSYNPSVIFPNGNAILLNGQMPFGGAHVGLPWQVTAGGTGANTAAGARSNLSTPAVAFTDTDTTLMELRRPDDTRFRWLRVGSVNSGVSSGIVPMSGTLSLTSLGSSNEQWDRVWAKTLNGSLAASNISGVLPIANGGTGRNSLAQVIQAFNIPSLSTTGDMGLSSLDLNDYKTVGFYICPNAAQARTIKNTPFGAAPSASITAFRLNVYTSVATNYINQRLELNSSLSPTAATSWVRFFDPYGSNWSAWRPEGGLAAGNNVEITPLGVINVNIPGTYATGTGSDTQITSAYYIAPKTMVIDMLINARAINGTGETVDIGSVALPVAIRDAKVNTSNGFTTVQSPTLNITGGGTAMFNFTITSANTLKVNGQLQSGQNIATQQVNAQIIIPVA